MAEIDNSLGAGSTSSPITNTSELINDGADGTSVYVEQDELSGAAFSNDYNDLDNLPDLSLKEDKSNKGIPNGYGSLDINGKQPLSEVNDALIGNVHWKGIYNGTIIISSSDPLLIGVSLPLSSSTNVGWYFISQGSFTYSGKNYETGDWIISNGIIWDKVDNTDAVATVFGRTGNIVAQTGDYTTAQVTEVTNKKYVTDAELVVLNNTSNTNTGDETTATIKTKLGSASTSDDGYLTSTDWNIFNNKQQDLKIFNKNKGIYYHEDFIGSQAGTVAASYGQVISLVSNGTALTSGIAIINRTNQQGVVRHSTTTSAAGYGGYSYGNANLYRGSSSISVETYCTIETLSTVTERFFTYFGYSTPSNWQSPSNAIGFTYDEGGVLFYGGIATTNWKCITRSGGTVTNTTTSIPVVAGQWYKLRIDVNNTGDTIQFYINGVLVATHTTNVPAPTTQLSIISLIVKTIGTTARTMQTDYFNYEEIFTNPR